MSRKSTVSHWQVDSPISWETMWGSNEPRGVTEEIRMVEEKIKKRLTGDAEHIKHVTYGYGIWPNAYFLVQMEYRGKMARLSF